MQPTESSLTRHRPIDLRRPWLGNPDGHVFLVAHDHGAASLHPKRRAFMTYPAQPIFSPVLVHAPLLVKIAKRGGVHLGATVGF